MGKKQRKKRCMENGDAVIRHKTGEELELLDLNEGQEDIPGYWYDEDEKEEFREETGETGEELEYLDQEIFGYYDDDMEEDDDYWEKAGVVSEGAADQAVKGQRAARQGRKGTSQAREGRKIWGGKNRRKKAMGMADKALACLGTLLMVFSMVAGGIYANAKTVERQVASFEEVGLQMEGIEVIGESGLLAMADAQAAKAVAEEIRQEESGNLPVEEYVEKEWKAAGAIKVEMHLSSMQKDLKIKFVNAQTGKLIPNVAFEVNVAGADKKNYVLKDEDMDGIIYAADVAPGKCTVAMNEMADAGDYEISTQGVEVTIKDKIEYKKVDVADEVKKESEVNAAIEDTGKKETAVESALADTVDWTESTKTAVEEGVSEPDGEFEEVPKDRITDPMTLAKAVAFMKFAAAETVLPEAQPGAGNEGTAGIPADGSGTAGGGRQPGEGNTADGPQAPEGQAVGSVPGGQAVEPVPDSQDGAAEPGSRDGAEAPDSGNDAGAQPGTPTGPEAGNGIQEIGIRLSQTALEMKTGESTVLTAVTEPAGNAVTWESSNGAAASVDGGKVTATGAGTAEISAVTATGNKAVCAVTVTDGEAGKPTIGLSSSNEKIFVGRTVELIATVGNAEDGTVSWQSGNEEVATVSPDGKVTGTAPGAAVITATCNADSSVAASCEITVKEDPEKDTVSRLVDNDGNQLYVAAGDGTYREAVYADYYTADKFYKKAKEEETAKEEEYKYTGWQTIDGKTYYFDGEGNKVTGEQVIQGARYNFDSDGALASSSGNMGIDVSKWNGSIDWNAVKNSGVSYVIIRCGYRGSTTGALIEDPNFRSNIQGASAAGLKVGVYFFTQAVNEVEAVEEASMVASLIGGYKISYPVFLDVEPSGGRADSISRDTRTAVCRAFCQTMQNSGYTAGIYANKTWLATHIDAGSLSNYKIWLAQYAAAPTYSATRYDIWQYSASGSVAGIAGKVDMNISYLGY